MLPTAEMDFGADLGVPALPGALACAGLEHLQRDHSPANGYDSAMLQTLGQIGEPQSCAWRSLDGAAGRICAAAWCAGSSSVLFCEC